MLFKESAFAKRVRVSELSLAISNGFTRVSTGGISAADGNA
jgi:hypothetical protein